MSYAALYSLSASLLHIESYIEALPSFTFKSHTKGQNASSTTESGASRAVPQYAHRFSRTHTFRAHY